MTDVPALDLLMGAYFHEDWDSDGDEWDVVNLFVRQEPLSAGNLPAEIEQTLVRYPDEATLKAFVLNDLGACYLADTSGGTFRGWLIKIADQVRAATT